MNGLGQLLHVGHAVAAELVGNLLIPDCFKLGPAQK